MTNRSVMTHQFSQVPAAEIPRSSFDRSHGLKTTFDAGYLIPIYVDEALPGDTFNLSMTGFARLATPIFPVMDNMFMETFFFAVPNRLIWENWVHEFDPIAKRDGFIVDCDNGVFVVEVAEFEECVIFGVFCELMCFGVNAIGECARGHATFGEQEGREVGVCFDVMDCEDFVDHR